jgi:hypothetical protein
VRIPSPAQEKSRLLRRLFVFVLRRRREFKGLTNSIDVLYLVVILNKLSKAVFLLLSCGDSPAGGEPLAYLKQESNKISWYNGCRGSNFKGRKGRCITLIFNSNA